MRVNRLFAVNQMTEMGWILILSCICSFIVYVQCGSIEFSGYYSHARMESYPTWHINFTNECVNPNSYQKEKFKYQNGISDVCLITFTSPNCISGSSQKYKAGSSISFRYGINSFHSCNDKEGGPQLDLDIIRYYPYDSTTRPTVLESYKDLCSCINVPQYIQKMDKWSIDNHHNDVIAYYGPNCSGVYGERSHGILPGFNEYSRGMSARDNRYKKQSIGPNPNSTYFKSRCYTTKPMMAAELLETTNNRLSQTNEMEDSSNKRESIKTKVDDQIVFFMEANFKDFLFSKKLNKNCTNFPRPNSRRFVTHQVSSLKTDACVILFSDFECLGLSTKLESGDHPFLWNWTTKSYHTCNNFDGGSQLHVDILEFHQNHQNSNKRVLEAYRNVCSCHNVPKYVKEMDRWSVDNHANEMLAYFEQDCLDTKWNPLVISAGINNNSIYISNKQQQDETTNNTYKISSFGPNPNSTYFTQNCQTKSSKNQNDIQIEFFAGENFKDFIFESNAISGCINLPKPDNPNYVTYDFKSIRTSTCIMLYAKQNCKEQSIKLLPNGSPNLTTSWEATMTGSNSLSAFYSSVSNWSWKTMSYKVCLKEGATPQLDVDIVIYNINSEISTVTESFELYRNICSCQNVPKYVQRLETWSVNNHGNSLVAYFEQDCKSNLFAPLWIPAGQSSYSMGFGSFKVAEEGSENVIQKIMSFGPDPDTEYFKHNCNKHSDGEYTLADEGSHVDIADCSQNSTCSMAEILRYTYREKY